MAAWFATWQLNLCCPSLNVSFPSHTLNCQISENIENMIIFMIVSWADDHRSSSSLGLFVWITLHMLAGIILCMHWANWETTLHCNIVSHWLCTNTKCSLKLGVATSFSKYIELFCGWTLTFLYTYTSEHTIFLCLFPFIYISMGLHEIFCLS